MKFLRQDRWRIIHYGKYMFDFATLHDRDLPTISHHFHIYVQSHHAGQETSKSGNSAAPRGEAL